MTPWSLVCGKIWTFWQQQQRATVTSNRRKSNAIRKAYEGRQPESAHNGTHPHRTLDIIDNYIDDREKDVETGRMSRSDFINEAVNRYLVELGLVEPESNTEVTPR